ncbi:MAG: SAM-dependent methyltransferase [Clostridia bacterium]|nr:SAM-dependent methyltransferase [Clostridia bacterium]
MKKIKSEKIDSLIHLFLELFEKKCLKKAVFSRPDATDEIKSVITPKKIAGNDILQLEIFSKDNKAYHINIKNDFYKECEQIFYSHSQINIISTLGDCQFMRSKGGRETIIGDSKIRDKLTGNSIDSLDYQSNNKEKKYILSGGEDFLKKLGISDENGRIHDKMQAKFRQINKFLEHIKSIEKYLPSDNLNIYDLCCGKSYLSFAVYHYFKYIKGISISMRCVDLKADVIEYCEGVAKRLGFDGMEFTCADINAYKMDAPVHLVISLHACDIATDIVLNKASENGARVILSTPCCHHELNHTINCDSLEFVTKHSMLRQKLCDALTDSLRLLKLEGEGYEVSALELIDPEDTPKNIILKAIKRDNINFEKIKKSREEYLLVRKFLLGEK